MTRILFSFFLFLMPLALLADGSDDEGAGGAGGAGRPAARRSVGTSPEDYERRLMQARQQLLESAKAMIAPGVSLGIVPGKAAALRDMCERRLMLRGLLRPTGEHVAFLEGNPRWTVQTRTFRYSRAFMMLYNHEMLAINALPEALRKAHQDFAALKMEHAGYVDALTRMDDMETFFPKMPLPLHSMGWLYQFLGSMAIAKKEGDDGIFGSFNLSPVGALAPELQGVAYVKPSEFRPQNYGMEGIFPCWALTQVHHHFSQMHAHGDVAVAWAMPILQAIQRLKRGDDADVDPSLYNGVLFLKGYPSVVMLQDRVPDAPAEIDAALAGKLFMQCLSFAYYFQGVADNAEMQAQLEMRRVSADEFLRGLEILAAYQGAERNAYAAARIAPSARNRDMQTALFQAATQDLHHYWGALTQQKVLAAAREGREAAAYKAQMGAPSVAFLVSHRDTLRARLAALPLSAEGVPLMQRLLEIGRPQLEGRIAAFTAVIDHASAAMALTAGAEAVSIAPDVLERARGLYREGIARNAAIIQRLAEERDLAEKMRLINTEMVEARLMREAALELVHGNAALLEEKAAGAEAAEVSAAGVGEAKEGDADAASDGEALEGQKALVQEALHQFYREKMGKAEVLSAEHAALPDWINAHLRNMPAVYRDLMRYVQHCKMRGEKLPDNIPDWRRFFVHFMTQRLPQLARGRTAPAASSAEAMGGGGGGGGGFGGGGKAGF